MSFPEDAFCEAVTLTKSDWSGEQVKVQKRLKKFSLHAGHEDMIGSARFKLDFRFSIWSIISQAFYIAW